MKALTRQVSTGQYHQASHTLVHVGVALSEIRLQRRFKNIVLLGGVEQTLKAMQKVISLLGKKKDIIWRGMIVAAKVIPAPCINQK